MLALRYCAAPAIASPQLQAVFFLFRRQRHAIRPFHQLNGGWINVDTLPGVMLLTILIKIHDGPAPVEYLC